MSVQTKAAPRTAPLAFRPWRMITLLAMLLAVALALLPYITMTAYSPSAPVDSPAAQRAMQTITLLSQGTRSVGDPYHDTARDWLVGELRGLGLEVQTQQTLMEGQPAPLVNILARLEGQNPGGEAVLLMAHYDSNPGSPGASDNGSGVSIVLEITRAIAQGPRPANDLIVLFTDGEEQGILGVPPFLERHEWAASVRAALNFDGISTGPVFLWQTSAQNGRLVDLYAATPHPRAMSWIDGIARVLPLDTDFRPFQQAGFTGASFTTPYLPIGYHTPLDQPSLVNPASIQHGIAQGLAVTQALLSGDLSATKAPDRVYLTLWGDLFVTYPASAASGLGVLAAALVAGILVLAVRRGAVRLRAVGSGALFTAANMLGMFLLQLAVELVLFASNPMLSLWVKIPGSLVLLMVLLGYGFWRLQKRVTADELLLGGQVIWAACALWSSLANPLFSPPLTNLLLVSLLPFAFMRLGLGQTAARAGRILTMALILLLGAPVVYLLYMINGLIWLPAAIGAVAFSLLLALIQPLQRLAAKEG